MIMRMHSEPFPKFTGCLKKIQLISNNMCFGPAPEPDEEIEQHLTITNAGRVWLSHYCYNPPDYTRTLTSKEMFTISKDAVNNIMEAVTKYFSSDYEALDATDIGSWELMLTNTDGIKLKVFGSLCGNSLFPDIGLSDIIRKNLGRDDLFLFDGISDEVMRVEIKYHRYSKIKPKTPPVETRDDYITLDYNESLIIDRKTETMEHISKLSDECQITKTYHIEGGIASLLDGIYDYTFTNFPKRPQDTIDDPLDCKYYMITIFSRLGKKRVISGTYEKYGLPTDWAHFIEYVYKFMMFYEPGELFDEQIYKKVNRRKSDLIFCNVEFEEYGRTYCYLADSDDYAVGDRVVVPAGPDNQETIVVIKSIEYRQPENAPYPVEKTKHILRKYGEDTEPVSSGWKDLYIENSTGSENGLILRDEEYKKSCRITLEKCPTYYAVTCGVYGSMFHTAFCIEEKSDETYEAMKKDLQEFIDSDPTVTEAQEFYERFTTKY